jgi:hypothetical protein
MTCTGCNALGAVTWQNGESDTREIIAIHGKFHSETGRGSSGNPVIVCTGCDTIQHDGWNALK